MFGLGENLDRKGAFETARAVWRNLEGRECLRSCDRQRTAFRTAVRRWLNLLTLGGEKEANARLTETCGVDLSEEEKVYLILNRLHIPPTDGSSRPTVSYMGVEGFLRHSMRRDDELSDPLMQEVLERLAFDERFSFPECRPTGGGDSVAGISDPMYPGGYDPLYPGDCRYVRQGPGHYL